MIKVLEQAIEKVRGLSQDRQHYAAEVLEQIAAAQDDVYRLSELEREFIREGLAALDRGEIATEAQVREVFDRFRG